jgi:hypothetical protein
MEITVMARVPITVLGYKCERCSHEWIPRDIKEPRVCPKCKSQYWDRSKETNNYDDFRNKIQKTLRNADTSLTWTEIRTKAGLSQLLPNNKWVKRLENDIGLLRERDSRNIILWKLT